jgi:Predicted transmembrane transcriptional regulator (anti-sigma factor)
LKRFSCAELVESVTAYLEGDLDPAERRGFDEHVRCCTSCAHHVSTMRATVDALGGLPAEPPLPPGARARLLDAFRRARRP